MSSSSELNNNNTHTSSKTSKRSSLTSSPTSSPRRSRSSSSSKSSNNSLKKFLNKIVTVNNNNPYARTHKKRLEKYIMGARDNALKNPPETPFNRSLRNKNAARAAEKQTRERRELNSRDYRTHNYISSVIEMIRTQLSIIQNILFILMYNQVDYECHKEKFSGWTLEDVDILKRVKQTLLNALDIIRYPKEKHPKLYNSPENNIKWSRTELKKVNIFFKPISDEIHVQRANIVIAKGNMLNHNGEISRFNIPLANEYNKLDMAFLEVLYMIL